MRPWLMGGLLVLLGVLVVALLMTFRVDVEAAARTGPRWRRSLIGTGLAVLVALGVVSIVPSDLESSSLGSTTSSIGDEDLAATAEWRSLSKTWAEAATILSGKRGSYPFNEKGRKRLLDALDGAEVDIQQLEQAQLLSAAEAGLLARELASVRAKVACIPAERPRGVTCYVAVALPLPAEVSSKRLADRLPLLERLAISEHVHPGVATKVLDTIEADANILADKRQTETLSDADRAKAAELSANAKAQVERIRARLAAAQGGGSLEDSPGWKTIMNAWTTAGTLADKVSTTAQRRDADKLLDEARLKAKELAAAGLLSKAEADLLCADADRLHKRIHKYPPTDNTILCYAQDFLSPVRESLERLSMRLPLLKQLATDGSLHPAAVRKVLPTIEADLKTLSDSRELELLDSKARDQAKATRTEAEAALSAIKKTLGEGR